MKLGLSSWALNWSIGVMDYPKPVSPMKANDIVSFAVKHGASVVQIADNLTASKAEIIEAATYARSNGLDFELGIAGTNISLLQKAIELSSYCGAGLLRALPHCGSDIPSVPSLIERIDTILPMLISHNITLAIENHDYYTSKDLAHVMQAIDHRLVGICLDSTNNYGCGESFKETTMALLPYVKNFHFKEFLFNRVPHQTGFLVTGAQIGSGLLDIKYFQEILPISVNWIIEQWVPWQGDINQTIMLEQEWAINGIEILHGQLKGLQ